MLVYAVFKDRLKPDFINLAYSLFYIANGLGMLEMKGAIII